MQISENTLFFQKKRSESGEWSSSNHLIRSAVSKSVARFSGEVEERPPPMIPPRASFDFTSLLVIIAQWPHPFPFRTRK
jgi:hypothetical protein